MNKDDISLLCMSICGVLMIISIAVSAICIDTAKEALTRAKASEIKYNKLMDKFIVE